MALVAATLRSMTMSVLIVDDHPDFRRFARALLEAGGFDVIGEADDGPRAVELVEKLHPSVVLLDVNLPEFDGFEVARLVCGPTGPTVVLTSSRPESDFGSKLDDTPAVAFLPKNKLSAENLHRLVA